MGELRSYDPEGLVREYVALALLSVLAGYSLDHKVLWQHSQDTWLLQGLTVRGCCIIGTQTDPFIFSNR